MEGGLTVSGYNMQTGIRAKVSAGVEEAGEIVLNARLFGDIIRRMPDDSVTLVNKTMQDLKIEIESPKMENRGKRTGTEDASIKNNTGDRRKNFRCRQYKTRSQYSSQRK